MLAASADLQSVLRYKGTDYKSAPAKGRFGRLCRPNLPPKKNGVCHSEA